MTRLEVAQALHFRTERGTCRRCGQAWPCDFQLQRWDAFQAWARVEELEAAVAASRRAGA